MPKLTSATEALAKLAKLLGRGSEEAAPAVAAPATEKAMQYAVVKPDGRIFGAPFSVRAAANHIAENLNSKLPGHSVQEMPLDLSSMDKYTPKAPQSPNLSPEAIDDLMSRSGAGAFTDPGNGMAEGGPFDPVSSARERVSGQSSPGSPGVSGAIKDAVDALKSWMAGAQRGVAADRDAAIMRPAEESHADGGTTGVSTEHEQGHAGLLKRFGTRVAEQAYGLDDQGNPALGGRAWTKGQGGTPMGFLDEVTSIPHNLISLARTTRGLVDAPFARHMPGYAQAQDSMLDSMDPQWSKDASDRLERLRQGMNRHFGVDEAQTFPEHMTDAAASLVSPIPAAGEGKTAGAAGRLIEMTMPVRPRTLKNFAQDATMMGGASTGIDALTQRLSRLRAQQTPQGGGTPVDPEHFSQDMGVDPGPQQNIRNNHQMVPLVSSDGSIVYGVDPQTFAGGGGVSRRGFLGILATAPVALSKLAERLSPETETSVKSMDKSSLADSLRNIKSEAFGHSDEPHWGFLDQHVKTLPDSGNVLQKYLNFRDAFHHPDYSLGDVSEGTDYALHHHSVMFENSLDDLASQHGLNPLPNPNE